MYDVSLKTPSYFHYAVTMVRKVGSECRLFSISSGSQVVLLNYCWTE